MKRILYKPTVFLGTLCWPLAGLVAFVFTLSAPEPPPIEVSVADYGAVAGDELSDQDAFAAALRTVVACGRGTVLVPPGTYDFDARKTIDLLDASVTLVGSGKGVTVLRCRNSTGIWWFPNSGNGSQLSISDLTFMPGASGSSGTAIQINNPSLTSNTNICSLYMERVGFESEERLVDFFHRHIYTTYLMNPVFIDVFITSFGMTDVSESGFRINYGSGAYFENCYSKGNDLGWTLTNYKGCVVLNRCNPVGNDTGIQVAALADEECTVDVLGAHVNTVDTNIEIYRADRVYIENAASYTSTTNAFTDFYLDDCTDVDIVGCEFHQPYTAIRTMVHLAGTTRDVLLKQNIFNGKTADPNGNSLITDVLIEAGVSNVTQQDNLSPLTHQW
ncbi:glycosyl hydrolase family 28-related protein [Tichowtungia aerotolerans]|uniref:Rhamnogalacturonase A/B/Epimerase-like pectate lyase domain-containing protein n=1 Tax=Tichowtungia aerotolerans TaxID=2697043 RepID=A0A6P1M854_9BACT|nr:glycosyl hydrolase family 28-related protein [Tichowtungia aerotolerans]QHI70770.1 hypothetical protein GT409_15420 [Tichowtungia aerotolerans]